MRAPSTNPDGRKAMLLRVGMDRGTGGALGPIFPDGTFEYVPVPEAVPTRLGLTYATLPGRHVGSLAAVLPARLAARRPHLDPDFAAATYGDTAAGKRRQLLRLTGGDRLIFYAGLAPSPPEDRPRLFAIGELEVRRVHDLKSADFARADLQARFGDTAHFLRLVPDEALALVEGVPSSAKLFDRAVPLGDAQNRALPELARVSYQGSLLRSVGHWIRGAESLRFLDDWLRDGPVSLICADSRLFSLDAAAIDSWPAGELALDGERMREGDWFVALGGRGASEVRAFGRVNRGSGRTPAAVSSLFWAFPNGGPGLENVPSPASLRQARAADASSIRRVASWFSARYRIGVHRTANPAHLNASRNP